MDNIILDHLDEYKNYLPLDPDLLKGIFNPDTGDSNYNTFKHKILTVINKRKTTIKNNNNTNNNNNNNTSNQ